jgi:trigger factor
MTLKDNIINFKSKIIDKKFCFVTIGVEVPADIVTSEINSIFNSIHKQIKINGFRQGKTPINIIKEKFFIEIKDRGIESIIKKTILNAIRKENFFPVNSPIIEKFDYKLKQNLKYRFTVECHPKIENQDYKNIPLKKEIFKITNEDLLYSIDIIREKNAKIIPSKSNKVNKKSLVSIDYHTFYNNDISPHKIIVKKCVFDLGSNSTPKEFKEALIGERIGSKKDVEIKYPISYPNKTLAGKNIIFRMTIIKIEEKEIQELNDDFAKEVGAKNLEDLKLKIRKTLEIEENHRQDINIKEQIIKYLLDKNKFDVPQCLIIKQKKYLIEKMVNYMKSQNISEENIENHITLNQKKFEEESEKSIRLSYILNAIYINENLEVTNADIEIEKTKALNSISENLINEHFTKEKETIITFLKERKIFNFLLANSDIKLKEKICIK